MPTGYTAETLRAAREAAGQFAEKHVAELSRNIIEWHDTALLPPQCKLREFAVLCATLDQTHHLQLAEAFTNRAALNLAASKP